MRWPRLFGFAGAWVLAELLRVFLFTGFPWNPLGSVWAFDALPVQAAAVIGVHGLSLLTVVLAGLPAAARGWRPFAIAASGLAALAVFGAWRLAVPEASVPDTRLILVQGNIAQELKWQAAQREANFRRYLDLTRQALAAEAAAHPGSRLVAIWPETASPYLLAQDTEAREQAAETLPPGATLLAGTVRAEWDATNRLQAVWNSLVAVNDDGVVAGVYDKAHLVPFGEYMPLSGLLPIRLAAGGMDFSAGPGPVAVTVPALPPFGVLICYEAIFPGAIASRPRPDWLVNITNDGWFGTSSGPWQHLAAALCPFHQFIGYGIEVASIDLFQQSRGLQSAHASIVSKINQNIELVLFKVHFDHGSNWLFILHQIVLEDAFGFVLSDGHAFLHFRSASSRCVTIANGQDASRAAIGFKLAAFKLLEEVI